MIKEYIGPQKNEEFELLSQIFTKTREEILKKKKGLIKLSSKAKKPILKKLLQTSDEKSFLKNMKRCSKILESRVEGLEFSLNRRLSHLLFFLSFAPKDIVGQLPVLFDSDSSI